MAKRGTVSDYAGAELYRGNLVCYSSRTGNRVRMTDAVIVEIKMKRYDGRLAPILIVRPTGDESGFVPRRSYRLEHVSPEHVRLVTPNATGEQQ